MLSNGKPNSATQLERIIPEEQLALIERNAAKGTPSWGHVLFRKRKNIDNAIRQRDAIKL
jgi:hypothetical protein